MGINPRKGVGHPGNSWGLQSDSDNKVGLHCSRFLRSVCVLTMAFCRRIKGSSSVFLVDLLGADWGEVVILSCMQFQKMSCRTLKVEAASRSLHNPGWTCLSMCRVQGIMQMLSEEFRGLSLQRLHRCVQVEQGLPELGFGVLSRESRLLKGPG